MPAAEEGSPPCCGLVLVGDGSPKVTLRWGELSLRALPPALALAPALVLP